ncbi:hypothetical protein [Chitinophaga niastensis]|nr:hypothetical protein [Chitinophaga niastensis]
MFKKLLFVCLSVFLFQGAQSQAPAAESPTVVRSTPFDEPERGANRLLLMKNGNTLFFSFTPKKGIDVTVFDQQHQSKPVMKNRITSWKNKQMSKAQLEGLYEINGQAVVFLQQYVKKKPCLFRFIFDAANGKLIEEKLIADLPRIGMGQGYAIAFGGMKMPEFDLRKDPNSEYYAVAMLNSKAHESGERIKVIHFNPQHQVINESFFDTPKGDYKYINLADMYVQGDKFVFLSTFAYNTRSSGGKDSRFVIGSLAKGDNQFKSVLLDYTEDFKLRDVALKYSNLNNSVYLLTTITAKTSPEEPIMSRSKTDKFSLLMNEINPENLTVKQHYFIDHPMLDKYAQKHLKYKKKYQGVIQDFNLNADGTINLLLEEMDIIAHTYTNTNTNGRGGITMGTSHTTYTTRLGEMGIVQLAANGKEINSYAIAKSQEASVILDIFDLNRRNQSSWNFRGKRSKTNLSGFYSYDFFNTNNKDYIIYNDYPENKESNTENYRRKKNVKTVSKTNTICAIVDGQQITKTYLFGDPGDKTESRFSQMEMITKNADGKSFSTMMIERKGRHKKAYIVWVSL